VFFELRGGRTGGEPRVGDPVFELGRVVEHRRPHPASVADDPRAAAPSLANTRQPFRPSRFRPPPRVVLLGRLRRRRAEEHQRRNPLGPSRCDQDRRHTSVPETEQGRLRRTDLVQHDLDVFKCRFDRRRSGDAIGEAGTAAIHQNESREARQSREESGERRIEPRVLDVGEEAAEEHEVLRAFTNHLIGQRHVAVAGVLDVGPRHLRASQLLV
jgi:hypothetical protein